MAAYQGLTVYENSGTPPTPAANYRSLYPTSSGWKELDSAGNARFFAKLDSDNASLTVAGGLNVGTATGAGTGGERLSDGTRLVWFQPRTTTSGTGLSVGYDLAVYSAHVLNLAGDLGGGTTAGGVNIGYWSPNAGVWLAALSVRNSASTYSTLNIMPDGGTTNIGSSLNIGTATGAAVGAWRAKVATGEQIWMRPPGDFGAGYGPIIQAVDSAGTGSIQLVLAGSSVRIMNELRLDISTAASASAGGGATLPATVAGYLVVSVAGTNRKIPFYAT